MKGFGFTILALLFIKILAAQPTRPGGQPGNSAALWPDKKMDSLMLLLKNSKEDTNRVLLLYELGTHCNLQLKNKETLKYGTAALNLSKKLSYIKGECLANYILGIYSSLVKNYTGTFEFGKKTLILSQQTGFQQGVGMAYFLIGYYYAKIKEYKEAVRNSLVAKDIFETGSDKINIGRIVNLLAAIYRFQDNYREAIKNYITAASIWKEAGYRNPEASVYERIAEMFSQLGGNYHQAIEFYTKALNIWQSMAAKREIAGCYYYIGNVFLKLNEHSYAIQNFSTSLNIYKELGDTIGIAENINSIGELYTKQGNYSGALEQFYKSLEFYKQASLPDESISLCYFNIGYVFKFQADAALDKGDITTAENNYKKALENYLISLRGYRELSNRAYLADVSVHIGEVYIKLRNFTEAGKFVFSGLQSALQIGKKETIVKAYLFLSQLDSAKGNYTKAYTNLKLHLIYHDSLLNTEALKKVEAARLQGEVEKKEQEINLLSAENKLKTTVAEKQSQRKKTAYGIIVIIILLSGYAFYHYRRFMRNKSEQKTLRDRLQISQDLHDNIGSTLSSISVYSKVAQIHGEKKEKEDLSELLEKISSTSNEMVTEMNDIVWAINPRNDSIEKIIQRMESFARPLAAARNIHFDLQYDQSVLSLQLDMDKRKNFYLIFKEAINNAIKYSGASELNALIKSDNHQLKLIIKDNGIGFNPVKEMNEKSTSLSGNGLRNMQTRAAELNGSLTIQSHPASGTVITIQLPYA